MEIDELLWIKKRLEELYTEWYIAKGWKDGRSREKKIREACTAISKYAMTLPQEVLGLFDSKVAPAALNSQFAGDDDFRKATWDCNMHDDLEAQVKAASNNSSSTE